VPRKRSTLACQVVRAPGSTTRNSANEAQIGDYSCENDGCDGSALARSLALAARRRDQFRNVGRHWVKRRRRSHQVVCPLCANLYAKAASLKAAP
jgi:hypothetical protein